MIRTFVATLSICAAAQASAQGRGLPDTATLIRQVPATSDVLALATGPFDGDLPQITAEGMMSRTVWKIADTAMTSSAVLAQMRDTFISDGFTETFACDELRCGGFDFRYAIDLLPPPEMQVNLGDYHYWTGSRGEDYAMIFSSRIADTVYLQLDEIGADTPAPQATPNRVASRTAPSSLGATLAADGRAILSDLSFAIGSSALTEGEFTSLSQLADYLSDNANLRVALVGHTDTAGSLAGNIALSKRRAQSVMARLINTYGVSNRQVTAEGMGYLAPIANNLTAAGRDANRRVEVIVLGIAE